MDTSSRHAPVATLRQRREFLRVRGGGRWTCSSFVIETRRRVRASNDLEEIASEASMAPRIGYTVTKKMGNAVRRNRIKRRFRAAIAHLETGELRDEHDYVLIARSGALQRAFVDLTNDLREGLKRIHAPRRKSRGGRSPGKLSKTDTT